MLDMTDPPACAALRSELEGQAYDRMTLRCSSVEVCAEEYVCVRERECVCVCVERGAAALRCNC